MRHSTVLLIALAACKGGSDDTPRPGINHLQVEVSRRDGGYVLELRYTLLLTEKPASGEGASVRATCLAGTRRFTDVGNPANTNADDHHISGTVEVGVPKDIDAIAFLLDELGERPTMCDLEFHAGYFEGGKPLDRFCWREGETLSSFACPAK